MRENGNPCPLQALQGHDRLGNTGFATADNLPEDISTLTVPNQVSMSDISAAAA